MAIRRIPPPKAPTGRAPAAPTPSTIGPRAARGILLGALLSFPLWVALIALLRIIF